MRRWIAHIDAQNFFSILEEGGQPPPERYVEASNTVRQILSTFTSRLEPESLDRFFLDITEGIGMDATLEEVLLQAQRALSEKMGLQSAIGAGPSRIVARMASGIAGKNAILIVSPENLETFLQDRSVRRLWGFKPRIGITLSGLGIQTLGDLRQVPLPDLVAHFGKEGYRLAMVAQGLDPIPQNKQDSVPTKKEQLSLPFDS